MILSLVFVLASSKTGVLAGRVTLGPLSAIERRAHHTHFDKAESVEGFDLQIYRIARGKLSDTPAEDTALGERGDFTVDLQPGRYEVTVSREMHAGAYSVYPTKMVRVRLNKTTYIKLHIRSEYFD